MTPRFSLPAVLLAALMGATVVQAGPTATKPAPKKTTTTVQPAAKKPVAKTPAKPGEKTPAKPSEKKPAPAPVAGKTPAETVNALIKAMRNEDKDAISKCFDWHKFAAEMNKLVPDKQGLSAEVYKTLLIETFNVGPELSKDIRLGKVTPIGTDKATAEMERLLPVSEEKDAPKKFKTINILSLYKSPAGWRIYRLDSAKEPPIPVPKPAPPRAKEGMVPAAGTTPPAPAPAPAPGQ